MAWKKGGDPKEFKYSFRGINRVIEEKGNQFIRFAQIAWAGEDEEVTDDQIKFDLRKYTSDADGNERMLKGVSFFSKEGVDELANTLVEEGFGDTNKIVSSLKGRDDFSDAIKRAYGVIVNEDTEDEDDTYDIRSIIG